MKLSASIRRTPGSSTRAGLAAAIKLRARALGFELVGITSADPPEHLRDYQDWVAQGMHGEMHYLERRSAERLDLQRVLNGARSVVVVGLNYGTSTAPDVGREMPGEMERHPHPNPLPQIPLGAGRERGPGRPASTACGRGRSREAGPGEGAGQVIGLSPRIARYAQGSRDYHDILAAKLAPLEQFIRDAGGPDTGTKWYVDTGPVLERDLAHRAGIGFTGKHTNLISRTIGNWFVIGEILTTLELAADEPAKPHCGKCVRCIDACPTQAIVAPYTLDARLCISYLTIELKGSIPVELRPLIGDRVFGCDDCLAVCPWNRFAQASPVKEFQQRDLPPLPDFLAWDETTFNEFFRGTPIYRLKRRGFLRNVCVALGNIGDPATLPALERAMEDAEPLVREHAAWAVERIRRAEGSRGSEVQGAGGEDSGKERHS